MTPLSQVLNLVTSWKDIDTERTTLMTKMSAQGDMAVDIDVLFAEGPFRTKSSLSAIIADLDAQKQQIANALSGLGIDVNS